jgi:hypothetical protein
MARPRRIGRCVHCLLDGQELTDDHIFPVSWYPENAPPDLERWKAPSCRPCNAALGKMEADFLMRLALCVNPQAATTAGIVQRALRAMDPEAGRNLSDQQARAALRRKIDREVQLVPSEARVLKPFSEKWGRPPEEQFGIHVPGDYLRRLGEKMARGIHFMDGGQFIELPLRIRVGTDIDGAPPDTLRMVREQGRVYAIEPGIVVRRLVPPEAPAVSLLEIQVWGLWSLWVTVS